MKKVRETVQVLVEYGMIHDGDKARRKLLLKRIKEIATDISEYGTLGNIYPTKAKIVRVENKEQEKERLRKQRAIEHGVYQ